MENNLEYLNGKTFIFGGYAGQRRCLRKVAVDLWGEKEVSLMTDFDIETKFLKLGYIPIVINFEGNNQEYIYLIEKEKLSFTKCLSR
jgi:hypothetical protein